MTRPFPRTTTLSNNRGFTLTELIVILVVIGVLAVFVAPTLGGMTAIRQRTEYGNVVSAIAYARRAAIAKRRYACVSVSSTAVTFTIDSNPPESTSTPFGGTCPFVTALNLPSKDQSCPVTNQTCLKYTSISSTSGTFQFDSLGRASATVTITMSGFAPITVEGDTGYVH
jgi:MSHA pilin protein MshC